MGIWRDFTLIMMSEPHNEPPAVDGLLATPKRLTGRIRLRNQMRLIVIYRLDVQRPHYPP